MTIHNWSCRKPRLLSVMSQDFQSWTMFSFKFCHRLTQRIFDQNRVVSKPFQSCDNISKAIWIDSYNLNWAPYLPLSIINEPASVYLSKNNIKLLWQPKSIVDFICFFDPWFYEDMFTKCLTLKNLFFPTSLHTSSWK